MSLLGSYGVFTCDYVCGLIDRLFHHRLRQHRKIRKKKKAIERREQREKETKNQRMNKVNGEETKEKFNYQSPATGHR